MTSSRYLVILMLGAAAACGGAAAGRVAPAPAEPEASIAGFLAAAKAGDLGRLGELWGDERGSSSATRHIPAEERQRRLTIIARLLGHDEYRITGWEPSAARRGRRVYQVELSRGGRRAVVPFTLAPSRAGGWLVAEVGLDAAVPVSRPPQP
ncbi:MAG: hypothetical protein A2083_11160 [Gemmatimonadetes bacterium GWC2_71_9]|nr:MAG: hypothetical protein A2083_11160 [Gemmatimonadetes bacterium GWC2_71_9]